MKSDWAVLWHFCLYVVVGTLIFALFAAPALCLGEAVRWLETREVDKALIIGIRIAEYFLFGADLILFGIFVVCAAIKTGRRLR
jgi:hypothetical protein